MSSHIQWLHKILELIGKRQKKQKDSCFPLLRQLLRQFSTTFWLCKQHGSLLHSEHDPKETHCSITVVELFACKAPLTGHVLVPAILQIPCYLKKTTQTTKQKKPTNTNKQTTKTKTNQKNPHSSLLLLPSFFFQEQRNHFSCFNFFLSSGYSVYL